jgi:pimeloyl-ACP methyl ester carboxylesterase
VPGAGQFPGEQAAAAAQLEDQPVPRSHRLLYQAPRSWAERAYPHNLIHYNQLDRGGHFAAWEQPQLFSEEMRAAFKTLR